MLHLTGEHSKRSGKDENKMLPWPAVFRIQKGGAARPGLAASTSIWNKSKEKWIKSRIKLCGNLSARTCVFNHLIHAMLHRQPVGWMPWAVALILNARSNSILYVSINLHLFHSCASFSWQRTRLVVTSGGIPVDFFFLLNRSTCWSVNLHTDMSIKRRANPYYFRMAAAARKCPAIKRRITNENIQ